MPRTKAKPGLLNYLREARRKMKLLARIVCEMKAQANAGNYGASLNLYIRYERVQKDI